MRVGGRSMGKERTLIFLRSCLPFSGKLSNVLVGDHHLVSPSSFYFWFSRGITPENICSFKGSSGPSGSSPECPTPQWYHRPFATNVHAQRFRGSEPHLILIKGGSIMIPTTWMKKLSLRAVNCSIQAHTADRTSTDLPSLDL